MESSPNINADVEYGLKRKVQKATKFLIHSEAPLHMSNHYNRNHFVAQPELPFGEYEQAVEDYEKVFDK